MHTFTVRICANDSIEDIAVDAEYFLTEDGLVTFKDADHKQVAAFNEFHVVAVQRLSPKPATVGSVTISVKPVIEASDMDALVNELITRVRCGIERVA